jgi:hypothetical protein
VRDVATRNERLDEPLDLFDFTRQSLDGRSKPVDLLLPAQRLPRGLMVPEVRDGMGMCGEGLGQSSDVSVKAFD